MVDRTAVTPVFSFVVPTLAARAEDARRCVASLRREAPRPSEVLLVCESGEHGRAFADLAAAAAADGLDVRPVVQPGGAAKRRNAAFAALRGRVVVLIDDDAEAEPGYGAGLSARFGGGGAALVQGAIRPAFDVEPPEAIRPVLFSVGGFNCLGAERRTDVFISANCAFSREVLDAAGPMREDLGPGSGGAAWGDDTEWAMRARAKGFAPAFDEAIAVRHRIQAERLTEAYVLSRAERVGRTRARLEWAGRRPGALTALKQRALAAWAATKGSSIEARCLRARLRGYADEVAELRG
ncbi:MAG: hypothetical protein HMLKMBBP_02073 [Planctomycetes bacterium]|nr:hypothetical protein [Planctomycetota bacterium]